jgi:hypothetical protein
MASPEQPPICTSSHGKQFCFRGDRFFSFDLDYAPFTLPLQFYRHFQNQWWGSEIGQNNLAGNPSPGRRILLYRDR